MERFSEALQAYRSLDPAGWVQTHRLLPPWAGLLLIAGGGLLLALGGGRAFRGLAALIGLWVGLVWIPPVAERLGLSAPKLGPICAAVLCAVGVAHPGTVLVVAFGLPVGLIAGQLVGAEDWLLGFVPGFIVAGGIASVFQRFLGAVAASLLGGWLVVLGGITAVGWIAGAQMTVTRMPWLAVGAALAFGLAGIVYQVFVRPSPEDRAQLAAERARAKRKREDLRALERRWSNYSKRE